MRKEMILYLWPDLITITPGLLHWAVNYIHLWRLSVSETARPVFARISLKCNINIILIRHFLSHYSIVDKK
jgi:hypothetical protein